MLAGRLVILLENIHACVTSLICLCVALCEMQPLPYPCQAALNTSPTNHAMQCGCYFLVHPLRVARQPCTAA